MAEQSNVKNRKATDNFFTGLVIAFIVSMGIFSVIIVVGLVM